MPETPPTTHYTVTIGGNVAFTNAHVMYMRADGTWEMGGVSPTGTGGTFYLGTTTGTSVTGFSMQPGTIVSETVDATVRDRVTPEPPAPLTPEQQAEFDRVQREEEAQRARWREARRAEEAERLRIRNEAEARSRELLELLLNEEQRAQYQQHGHFDVMGSSGRNRYRIMRGSSGNVHWLEPESDAILGRLCAHPTFIHENLPLPDVAAGQMLALMTDEEAFIRIANVHQGHRPEFPEPVGARGN